MRTFVVARGTDFETLRASLIDRRISAARAEAALMRLRALNPHVEFERAGEGTVLFVPDGPEFTARAAAAPMQAPVDEVRTLMEGALGRAAEDLKAGIAARAEERAAMQTALASAAFRRAIAGDPALQQQAEAAAKALAEEEAADRTAPDELDATRQAALAALAELGKLAV